jgi:hypothetical protein
MNTHGTESDIVIIHSNWTERHHVQRIETLLAGEANALAVESFFSK